jgi:hypothetical protein
MYFQFIIIYVAVFDSNAKYTDLDGKKYKGIQFTDYFDGTGKCHAFFELPIKETIKEGRIF